ncbi:MAG: glycine betaine ABC transporter substrate-binding protein [Bryobacteraceae bacterium]
MRSKRFPAYGSRLALVGLLLACLLIGACGRKQKPIIVGSKNSTDQMILGEIIAQHLETRLGRPIQRRLGVGNTMVTYQTMQSDQINVYPEFTGTMITEILREQPATDAALVFERARGEMRRVGQIEVLDPLGFSAEPVGVIASADPRAAKTSNLSEAAGASPGWKIAVSFDFQQRLDGVPAITQYHLPMTDPVRAVEAAELYRSIEQGQVSMVFGTMTDGQLALSKWKALRDDKSLFTPQQACILVRKTSIDAEPNLQPVLSELSGRISTEAMQRMNAEVIGNQRPIADVAKEFLARKK